MDADLGERLRRLLRAYGHGLYGDRGRARADDLLVRQKAAGALGEAAGALRDLRTAYRRRFIPPPTRAQPSPPAERLESLATIGRLQERLADLEVRVRSMPAPAGDAVWDRYRRAPTLLNELLVRDYDLIAPCLEVRERTAALTPEGWQAAVVSDLEAHLAQIERAIRDRADFLQVPGG
jgi:hypothetical protein